MPVSRLLKSWAMPPAREGECLYEGAALGEVGDQHQQPWRHAFGHRRKQASTQKDWDHRTVLVAEVCLEAGGLPLFPPSNSAGNAASVVGGYELQ